jgi:radical SAM/Cys-rich protein
MDRACVDAVLEALDAGGIETLDITGGAPELSPHFRGLVAEARGLGRRVIARSNLTVFFEDGMEDIPEFYASLGVEVVASLPYYIEGGVDRVRGGGAFKKSVEALRRLNSLGYASGSSDRALNLVFNPQGAFLPPEQAALEEEYRRELGKRFGVSFDRLFALANMPIGRFREFLLRTGQLEGYMGRLSCAFNPGTLEGLMCRRLISVGWDGRLFDCDFNMVLGMGLSEGLPSRIRDFDRQALSHREIAVDEHCFGCTAGQGST